MRQPLIIDILLIVVVVGLGLLFGAAFGAAFGATLVIVFQGCLREAG